MLTDFGFFPPLKPLQVIDWLNNHGDVFLKKNTSIGKTLQRAKALQKSHEHFESVARVST